MQNAFLDINGVRTNVVTFGKWVEEQPKIPSEPEDIILMIPGNPGVLSFYKLFLNILYEKTKYPVWIVGHAGHEIPRNNQICPVPRLKGNTELYGLKAQIEQKRQFIEKYVPGNARLHLVGHSIGSYMILQLLKDQSFASRVQSVNLLFPTIEYMKDTPNGKFMTFLRPIIWLILFLSLIFTCLPSFLQHFCIYLYIKITGVSKMHINTITKLVNPEVLEKIFFLAYEELDQVYARDNEVLKENIKKIRLIYGQSDGWAPISYMENMVADIPDIQAKIVEYEHTYVLRTSNQPVANLTAQNILGNKN